MKDVREEMQEVMNQNADFARQLEESERDRAQLTARIGTLQVTAPAIDDFLMFFSKNSSHSSSPETNLTDLISANHTHFLFIFLFVNIFLFLTCESDLFSLFRDDVSLRKYCDSTFGRNNVQVQS